MWFVFFVGLQTADACYPCSGGYYCPTPGIVEPILMCEEGYYCISAAEVSAPDQGDYIFELRSLKHFNTN